MNDKNASENYPSLYTVLNIYKRGETIDRAC